MTGPSVAVLDYGIGNLRSAQKALVEVGADARLTSDPKEIDAADGIVLPGVGAFGACMEALEQREMVSVAVDAAGSGRPFLGICVGMQLLYQSSQESPGVSGLGIMPGMVKWLPEGVKHPQMQWNRLSVNQPDHPLMTGLDQSWLYFVHSLSVVPTDPSQILATTDYGGPIVAATTYRNIVATQFHPEKSASVGLRLLSNFVGLL